MLFGVTFSKVWFGISKDGGQICYYNISDNLLPFEAESSKISAYGSGGVVPALSLAVSVAPRPSQPGGGREPLLRETHSPESGRNALLGTSELMKTCTY